MKRAVLCRFHACAITLTANLKHRHRKVNHYLYIDIHVLTLCVARIIMHAVAGQGKTTFCSIPFQSIIRTYMIMNCYIS